MSYTDGTRHRGVPRFAHLGVTTVSIVRMGMAEDGKFGDGYEAIFGKKKSETQKPAAKETTAKQGDKKKPAKKKK